MPISCIPAYGKQFKTESEVIDHWNNGFDFKEIRGQYFSKRNWNPLDMVICSWHDTDMNIHTTTLERGVL